MTGGFLSAVVGRGGARRLSRSDEDIQANIRVIGFRVAADVNPSTPCNAVYISSGLGYYFPYESGPFDLAGGTAVVNGPLIRWVLGTDNIDCSLGTRISAGAYHSLALKFDNTVWSWGYNAYGQLGDGTTDASTTPVQVSGLSQVTAIAAGGYFSLARKSD
jgi:hypothetical protein